MRKKEISESIKRLINANTIKGASYAYITAKDSDFYYEGTMDGKQKVTSNARYDLASLTKVIATTTRIMQLIASGNLALQTKVIDILPNYIDDTITVESLLLHTSGLNADIENNELLNQEELEMKIYGSRANPDRQSTVLYSDIGYILLGDIITVIDGDLEKSIQNNVFKPLNMDRTSYRLKEMEKVDAVPTEYLVERGGVIKGEVHDNKAYVLGGCSGHAGVFSTLEDVSYFVQMLLNNGKQGDKQVMPSTFFEQIRSILVEDRTLGWLIYPSQEDEIYYHTGFTGTSIIFNISKKEAFVLLTNHIFPTRENQVFIEKRKTLFQLFAE